MASQRMAKHGERGLVRPLQVVEHDQHRAIMRQASEDRRHRLEDHEPLTGRLAPNGDAVAQLRQDQHEIRGDIAGKRGDLTGGEPVERPAERLRERLVRPQRLLVAPPVQHERAGVGDELREEHRPGGSSPRRARRRRGPPTPDHRRPPTRHRAARPVRAAAHQFGVAVEPQRRRHRRRGATAQVVQRHLGIRQVGVGNGVEVLGPGDAAQSMLAQVDQPGTFGDTVGNQRRGCRGGEDRRARGDGTNPSGAIDGPAVVITVADLDLAGVDADPHPQRLGRGPTLGRQHALEAHGRDDGGARPVEHAERGVPLALALDQPPPAASAAERTISSWRATASP